MPNISIILFSEMAFKWQVSEVFGFHLKISYVGSLILIIFPNQFLCILCMYLGNECLNKMSLEPYRWFSFISFSVLEIKFK